MPVIHIEQVEAGAALDDVKALLAEYWKSFGFTPCFQGFDREVAGLPGAYRPPSGRLALARVDGQAAGCVALKGLTADSGEMKRLYVRPGFRGNNIGRALMDWLIDEARVAGYRRLYGDTMPVMAQALAMYEGMGFQRIGPYSSDPTPGAIYLALDL